MTNGDGQARPAERVTVLVPCAGHARRFGAPYPKELHCIAPGVSLIDWALAPIMALARAHIAVRLVVVIAPHKLSVAEHLARYADDVDMVFVMQTPRRGSGLAGAIDAAATECDDKTLLILPDQVFDWSEDSNPVDWLLDQLATAPTGWAVLAHPETDPAVLGQEGALRVAATDVGPRVAEAAERPAQPHAFNAVWAAVGCAHGAAQLAQVVRADGWTPLRHAPACWVTGYRHYTSPDHA